jgi:hypothetical protein
MQFIIGLVIALIMRFPLSVGILLVGLGLWNGAAFFTDRAGWVSTTAQVTNVSEMCKLEATLSSSRRTSRVLKGTVPCSEVARARAAYPDQDFSITRVTQVGIAYVSAEGRRLTASKPASDLGLSGDLVAGTPVAIEFRASRPSELRAGGDLSGLLPAALLCLVGGCFIGFVMLRRRFKSAQAEAANPKPSDWAERAIPTRANEPVQGPGGGQALDSAQPVQPAAPVPRVARPAIPQRTPGSSPSPTRIVTTTGGSRMTSVGPSQVRQPIRSSSEPRADTPVPTRGAITTAPTKLAARSSSGLVAPPAPAPRRLQPATANPRLGVSRQA